MIFRINPASGVPIYLQLMEQIKHGIETGAVRPGEQLPGIRKMAETLVMNPNTVAKAYRELEHDGVIELRQGMGAFVKARAEGGETADRFREAQPLLDAAVARARELGLTQEEVRRVVDAALLDHYTMDGTAGAVEGE